ncbi:MAG: VOC family protein [Pseudomonadota bacterium]
MKIFTNVCSEDLQKSKEFYTALLGLNVKYDSDWFVQLCSPVNSEIEYGNIQNSHNLVPKEYRQSPSGMYVTFVVSDVDTVYQKALYMKLPIIQEPRNEFYGQRRFLTKDPDGVLLDVCSPWKGNPGDAQRTSNTRKVGVETFTVRMAHLALGENKRRA